MLLVEHEYRQYNKQQSINNNQQQQKMTTTSDVKFGHEAPSHVSTTLVDIKRTEKAFQAHFVGSIQKEGSASNVLSLLNEGDPRFDNVAKRHVWQTVQPEAMEKYFGISAEKIKALKEGESLPVNLESPKLGDLYLYIEVTETLSTEDAYDLEHWRKKAKQIEITPNVTKSQMMRSSLVNDSVGEQAYFSKEGKLVYSTSKMVAQSKAPIMKPIENTTLLTEKEVIAMLSVNVSLTPEKTEVNVAERLTTSDL